MKNLKKNVNILILPKTKEKINSMKTKITLVVLLISLTSFAQTFGIKAGVNSSKIVMNFDNADGEIKMKSQVGFHVGSMVEFQIKNTFSIESGLIFTTKKGFFEVEDDAELERAVINTFYLDIPLAVKKSFTISNTKVFGTFGSYLGMGLSGTLKNDIIEDGQTDSETSDISFGSDKNDLLKKFEFGLTAGIGIELKTIQIGITYNLGLSNIGDNDTVLKNRVLGLSVAYLFRKKK